MTKIKINKKVANRASENNENIHGLVNSDKVFGLKKSRFCSWQNDMLINACIYIVVSQQKRIVWLNN